MRIRVDGFVVCGVWLGVLAMLAYDVATEIRPLIEPALISFVSVAFIGIAWRRCVRRHRAEDAQHQMRNHVRSNKDLL
jgi:hypothetical protein